MWDVGKYLEHDMNDNGLLGDDLDCLYVPKGRAVTLYQNDHFTGGSTTITGPIEVRRLEDPWYDKVNSLKVIDIYIDKLEG